MRKFKKLTPRATTFFVASAVIAIGFSKTPYALAEFDLLGVTRIARNPALDLDISIGVSIFLVALGLKFSNLLKNNGEAITFAMLITFVGVVGYNAIALHFLS